MTAESNVVPVRVLALLPAHNEEASLPATVASLQRQTRVPDRIVVLADRCTDATVDVARALGCEVFETRDNTAKKAGALNQGLAAFTPGLHPSDFVLVVDADSVLCATWLADALGDLADPSIGAVSGAYVARNGSGLISLLQQAEYAQERRRISRRGGAVDVLSGTCALIEVKALAEVAAQRGSVLPGTEGQYYDERSLTEDFEITLALKQLGYDPHCFKHLEVVTDVMETWPDLFRQRLRWQRGTIESLALYGLTRLTRRLWAVQVLTYSATVLVLGIVGITLFVLASGASYDPRWLVIIPLFAVEQVVSSWRGGVGARVVAALLVPMWCYDIFRQCTYWVALTKSLRRADAAWN